MASVKRFPGCKNWTACYAVFTGTWSPSGRPIFKRRQQTTRLTDKDEALQIAITFERQSRKAASGAWNQMQAREFSRQISALSGSAPTKAVDAERFIRAWLASAKTEKAKGPKTMKNYGGIVEDIIEFLGVRRSRSIAEFNRPVIFEFRKHEQLAGKSNSTINKALGVIKQICDAASIDGSITEHPFNEVGPKLFLPRGKKTVQKRNAFTFAQVKKLVAATDPNRRHKDGIQLGADWQTFVLVTAYTGGRQQEPAKLRWEGIDLRRGIIVLDATKKNEEHLIPIHRSLLKHLRKIRPAAAKGYVMPAIAAQSGQALSKAFREIVLPRIGIVQPYHTKDKNPEKGDGRIVAKYGIHSLRHFLSTHLNAVGVTDTTRKNIVGHDDTQVSDRYTHVNLSVARAGLERVGSI